MLKLRINPLVVEDLRNIRDYIAEDNEKYAAKTDYKYVVWEDYVIIYKVNEGYIEIYRVLNRYQDLTRIFERHTI